MAPNHRAFLALLAFFEWDGKTEVLVLNVVEVLESHRSTKLAEVINSCLESFGIENKVSSLVVLQGTSTYLRPYTCRSLA